MRRWRLVHVVDDTQSACYDIADHDDRGLPNHREYRGQYLHRPGAGDAGR
jgi:hypothetical protein